MPPLFPSFTRRLIEGTPRIDAAANDAAMRLQAPWVNGISSGVSVKDIETVHRVMATLRKNLESHDEPGERA